MLRFNAVCVCVSLYVMLCHFLFSRFSFRLVPFISVTASALFTSRTTPLSSSLLSSPLLSSKVPNTPLPCTSLQVFSSAHGDYFRALAGAKSVSKQIEYMKEFGSAAPVLGDINTVMHLQGDANIGTTATAQVDVNVGIDVAVQAPSNSLQHTVGSAVNRYPLPTIVLSSRSCVNQPPDPIQSNPIQ